MHQTSGFSLQFACAVPFDFFSAPSSFFFLIWMPLDAHGSSWGINNNMPTGCIIGLRILFHHWFWICLRFQKNKAYSYIFPIVDSPNDGFPVGKVKQSPSPKPSSGLGMVYDWLCHNTIPYNSVSYIKSHM